MVVDETTVELVVVETCEVVVDDDDDSFDDFEHALRTTSSEKTLRKRTEI